MWETLKLALVAAATDLRNCLKTMAVPFNLIDAIETLEWVVRFGPVVVDEQEPETLTIRHTVADLASYADYAEGAGLNDLAFRIRTNILDLRAALRAFED